MTTLPNASVRECLSFSNGALQHAFLYINVKIAEVAKVHYKRYKNFLKYKRFWNYIGKMFLIIILLLENELYFADERWIFLEF